MDKRPHLLIVFHSGSGTTERLALAVYQGALLEESVTVSLLKADEVGAKIMHESDAVIFGTPENCGSMSGGLKNLLDRVFYTLPEKQKSYGLFVSAGNDGQGAIRQLEKIALGAPLKKVVEPLLIKGVPKEEDIEQARQLGQGFASGLAQGIF